MIGWLIAGAAALLLLLLLLYYYNSRFVVRRYTLETEKVERDLQIVLLSDLHNKVYGKENAPLLSAVAACAPDFIVIAGDLVDKRRPNIPIGVSFAEGCAAIAPTFYICGNHERERENFEEICAQLQKVRVLRDEWVEICGVKLLGLSDRCILYKNSAKKQLRAFAREEGYKIVALHRPMGFWRGLCICRRKVDLQLSGHTHGGVVHIPFLGPFFAPDEGFFPKYPQGLYEKNGVKLLVGGGLGNTRLPLRLFNAPEILEISIKSKKPLEK